jgi:hypothetical protein
MTRKANTSRRDRLRPFREVLGLTTSPADLKTFSRVRKILRYLVSCHYDFHLTNRGQADSTRSLFMLDVSYRCLYNFINTDYLMTCLHFRYSGTSLNFLPPYKLAWR